MKIMSFNTQHCLNYVEQKMDFAVMAKVIMDFGADIVGLNEMRGKGMDPEFAEQVEILSALTGMPYFYFAPAIDILDKGPYGNGFLSKIPILQAETIPIPDPTPRKYSGYYESRCVLKVVLEGGLTVLVTHWGLNPDEKENAVKTILGHLPEEKCILMGDFNVTPEDSVLHPIREKMKDTAVFFAMPKYSYPSDNPNQKIDYIFVSEDITVLTADISAIIASDHRPHVATIRYENI